MSQNSRKDQQNKKFKFYDKPPAQITFYANFTGLSKFCAISNLRNPAAQSDLTPNSFRAVHFMTSQLISSKSNHHYGSILRQIFTPYRAHNFKGERYQKRSECESYCRKSDYKNWTL